MTHLSTSEFVDFLEGSLMPARAGHIGRCSTCRLQADALSEMLEQTRIGQVPEPPPVFWERLSARVHEGIAATDASSRPWGFHVGWRMLGSIAAAAAVVLVFASRGLLPIGSLGFRTVERAASRSAPSAAPGLSPDVHVETAVDSDNGEAWEILSAAAADMRIEDARAAGMGVRPGAVDRAVQELSADELNELGRLLQNEMKRSD
jgi:hypothetical protein